MALQIERQQLEVENLIGMRRVQVLVRAEALVPGAGREAIDPLLADAGLFIEATDLQTDRIVIQGSVACQAVYRQGEESALRALTAQTTLSHVIDVPGAAAGMFARVGGEVDHVEARYENGHIIFQVTCSLKAQVLRLSPVSLIRAVSGAEGLQTVYRALDSVKLAAESSELALLRETVALPAALDARTTLMDWAVPDIEAVAPDLGGVRVRGRVLVETLVSSGVAGRPAVVVRYPIAFDQLVELPEWLAGNVFAEAAIRSIRTRVEPVEGEEGETRLACEIEARVGVVANATDSSEALTDIYATRGSGLEVERETLSLCTAAERVKATESVRGTVLVGEGAPGVGTVIAAQVRPAVGEWRAENGQSRVEGVLEATVLYLPGGSDLPAAVQGELPFSIAVPAALTEASCVELRVLSAEASALMSDRLELKVQLAATCETRRRERVSVVGEVEEGEPIRRRSGVVIYWPEPGEDAWTIGKRYGIPAEQAADAQPGHPLVLRS